ncbi:conserved protein [Mycobacterium ulcerans Agy99]|uniref:Conserved protein n=1 Tax=Mycobacterium ulcerans (strain Agy99) TaxID=362242 RepID=A0PLY5_MYCUA|nr:conserved protein [Mycobacterium ulcerans Agy99]
MTEQSYPVEVGHPPSALLRAINPVLGFLLRTPLAGSLGNQLMVLDFTGRKSGRHFSLPLSAHVIDNVLYALTGAAWKYNFSDGATAQVVHNGKTTAMRGDLIRDPDVVADLCRPVSAMCPVLRPAPRAADDGFQVSRPADPHARGVHRGRRPAAVYRDQVDSGRVTLQKPCEIHCEITLPMFYAGPWPGCCVW